MEMELFCEGHKKKATTIKAGDVLLLKKEMDGSGSITVELIRWCRFHNTRHRILFDGDNKFLVAIKGGQMSTNEFTQIAQLIGAICGGLNAKDFSSEFVGDNILAAVRFVK